MHGGDCDTCRTTALSPVVLSGRDRANRARWTEEAWWSARRVVTEAVYDTDADSAPETLTGRAQVFRKRCGEGTPAGRNKQRRSRGRGDNKLKDVGGEGDGAAVPMDAEVLKGNVSHFTHQAQCKTGHQEHLGHDLRTKQQKLSALKTDRESLLKICPFALWDM